VPFDTKGRPGGPARGPPTRDVKGLPGDGPRSMRGPVPNQGLNTRRSSFWIILKWRAFPLTRGSESSIAVAATNASAAVRPEESAYSST